MLNVSASLYMFCWNSTNTPNNYEVIIYDATMREIFEDLHRGIPEDEISQSVVQARQDHVRKIQGFASKILS